MLESVETGSGEKVSRCFHCRKCTNGCPLAFAMEVLPNQILRLIQLGLRDEVLRSNTIWICASCQTCTTRCPNDIDITHVMDHLRQQSLACGSAVAGKKVVKFHQAFLDSARRHGRIFELGMVGWYKLGTGDLMSDARTGWEMLKKGKLKFKPANIKGKREVRRMFDGAKKD